MLMWPLVVDGECAFLDSFGKLGQAGVDALQTRDPGICRDRR